MHRKRRREMIANRIALPLDIIEASSTGSVADMIYFRPRFAASPTCAILFMCPIASVFNES